MALGKSHFLLTGRPGVGKTTLVRGLVARLQGRGVGVGGFTTREVREQGKRVGFVVEEIGGAAALMAGVNFTDGPRVGRYGVDVAAFEGIALPSIERVTRQGTVVVIDELGQMELFSDAFVHNVQDLFDRDVPLVATVHAKAHPVTDAIKQRSDVELREVTRENRGELLSELTARLLRALKDVS